MCEMVGFRINHEFLCFANVPVACFYPCARMDGKLASRYLFDIDKDKVIPELQKYGGTVYKTSLSNEDEAKLKQALSKDEVKAVAEDSLELETS